jgi:hypothetical protein
MTRFRERAELALSTQDTQVKTTVSCAALLSAVRGLWPTRQGRARFDAMVRRLVSKDA